METRECQQCRKSFEVRRKHRKQRFCSISCASKAQQGRGPLDEEVDEFKKRYLRGDHMEYLVADLKRSATTLKRWRDKLGLPPRKVGNHTQDRSK